MLIISLKVSQLHQVLRLIENYVRCRVYLIKVSVTHLFSYHLDALSIELDLVMLCVSAVSYLTKLFAQVFHLIQMVVTFSKQVFSGIEFVGHRFDCRLRVCTQISNLALHQWIQHLGIQLMLLAKAAITLSTLASIDDTVTLFLLQTNLHLLCKMIDLFRKILILRILVQPCESVLIKLSQNFLFVILKLLVSSQVLRYFEHCLNLGINRSILLANYTITHIILLPIL